MRGRKQRAIDGIERALQAAKMERAHFGEIGNTEVTINEKDMTEFIKERTRLYRGSWIIAPLEQALEALKEMK